MNVLPPLASQNLPPQRKWRRYFGKDWEEVGTTSHVCLMILILCLYSAAHVKFFWGLCFVKPFFMHVVCVQWTQAETECSPFSPVAWPWKAHTFSSCKPVVCQCIQSLPVVTIPYHLTSEWKTDPVSCDVGSCKKKSCNHFLSCKDTAKEKLRFLVMIIITRQLTTRGNRDLLSEKHSTRGFSLFLGLFAKLNLVKLFLCCLLFHFS